MSTSPRAALRTATATLAPLIRDGKLRALACFSEKRAASLPDVPTVAEDGLPGRPVRVRSRAAPGWGETHSRSGLPILRRPSVCSALRYRRPPNGCLRARSL